MAEADEAARRQRAQARTARLGGATRLTPADRVSLAAELSQIAWSFSGKPWPSYTRATIPARVITRVPR